MDSVPNQPAASIPPPVSELQTPPPTPKSKTKSMFLIIIAVLAALLLSSLGVFYVLQAQQNSNVPSPAPVVQPSPSPTPDPTANWKTYINTKVGYSFKYPGNLLPHITEDQTGNAVQLSNVKPPISIKSSPWNIYINAFENKENLNIAEYIDKMIENQVPDQQDLLKTIERKEIAVGDIIGESIIGLPAANIQKIIVISHNNMMFEITMDPHTTGNSYDQSRQDTFDQILSTFKFTP